MRDFKGLIVWQKAHRLTVAVYAVTASFLERRSRLLQERQLNSFDRSRR